MSPVPGDPERYWPTTSGRTFRRETDSSPVIMAAVDGGAAAERAVAYAAGLACRQHAHLVVVFIAVQPSWTAVIAPGASAAVESTLRDLATEIYGQVRART